MPRPRKRGLDDNSSITSFVVKEMNELSKTQAIVEIDTEGLTLKAVKDVVLKEFSDRTGELKNLRQDVRKFDL